MLAGAPTESVLRAQTQRARLKRRCIQDGSVVQASAAAEPGEMTPTDNMNWAEEGATVTAVECGRPGPAQLAGRGGPYYTSMGSGQTSTPRLELGVRPGCGRCPRPSTETLEGGKLITGGGGAWEGWRGGNRPSA